MKKYTFIQTEDPDKYKAQIVKFWTEYLKGTPADRFRWLTSGNPFGKTIWILTFTNDSEELIGLVTLMPKRVFYKSKIYHGAIMGDLMIHRDHRVFGPVLNLLKKAVAIVNNNQLDFIYTMPNFDSLKIIQKAGLKNRIDIGVFIKPINTRYFLKRHLPKMIPRRLESFILFSSSIMKLFISLLSRQTYVPASGEFLLSDSVPEHLDHVWEKHIDPKASKVFSLRNQNYLQWRYQQNPTRKYSILVHKNHNNEKPFGYAIYSIKNNKLIIHDMLCLNNKSKIQIIKKIEKIAKQQSSHAVYFSKSISNSGKDPIQKYGFMKSNDRTSIFWIARPELSFEGWDFVEGDRNI